MRSRSRRSCSSRCAPRSACPRGSRCSLWASRSWPSRDSAFWYLNALNPRFSAVSPVDVGWVAGFLVITVAAAQRHRPAGRTRKRAGGRLLPVLPTLPAAVGVATVLVSWSSGANLGPPDVLLCIGAAVLLLALLPQLIAVYENHALTSDLERRVAERTAELRATECYYRALVQHSSDVITVVDPELTVRYVSDSMVDVFGHEPSEFLGRGLEDGDRGADPAVPRAAASGGGARSGLVGGVGTDRCHGPRPACRIGDHQPHRRPERACALVVNTRDATDRVALQHQLRHQALHDPLTGLANRALLTDRAEQALARSARSGATVAVVLVDLDGFKSVNDSLGHQVGDIVLGEVARRLESLVRSEDTVARLGGDEFVILIDDVAGLEDITVLAERIREALRERISLPGWDYSVTASVGAAIGSAAEVDVHELLRDADTAMYVAKTGGKDSVRLFAPSMHQRAHERFRLQVDLREALERSELLLFYQPIFEMLRRTTEGL